MSGYSREAIIDKSKSYLRDNVFTVSNVLKAVDLSGAKLSFTAIEIIRKIDAPDKYDKSMFPCRASLSSAARKLNVQQKLCFHAH